MNTQVASILQKDMTRKEFLTTLGLAGASVVGLSSIIKLTTGKSLQSTLGGGLASTNQHHGYGASPYGK